MATEKVHPSFSLPIPVINHYFCSLADYYFCFCHITALAGNYVNFGVFELYGDRALADALDISLKMTLSIPLTDILAYRKVINLIGYLDKG